MTNAIENFIENDIVQPVKNFFAAEKPSLDVAWAAAKAVAERNGGELLANVAADVVPLLVTMKWGDALAKLIADAEAIGVVFIEEEKALAASTALQIAQAAASAAKPA